MKTRIAILISFVLLLAACKKDTFQPEPETPRPELGLISPLVTVEYGANVAIPIQGSISDPEIIKTLSIMVFRDESAKDTLFRVTRVIESSSCTFDESWTPSSYDFTNSENTYLLELKITHDPASAQPSLSFFQGIRVYR
jgi:hypothetical protein